MLNVTSVSRISEKQGFAGIATPVLKLCGQQMATGIFYFLLAGSWELQDLFPVAQEQHPSSPQSSSPTCSCLCGASLGKRLPEIKENISWFHILWVCPTENPWCI